MATGNYRTDPVDGRWDADPASNTGGVARPLTGYQRAGSLSPGQVVTLLVGIGIQLHQLHRLGRRIGWLQPRHILLGSDGCPRIEPGSTAVGWDERDDVVALLRLGMSLAGGTGELAARLRERSQQADDNLADVVRWLVRVAPPAPLTEPR
jgi:hypothetical protein